MGIFDIFKRLRFGSKGPKMLDSGKGEVAVPMSSNKPTLQSRINVRNLSEISEQYKGLCQEIKTLDGKDDEYLSEFYDSLIEICDKGPEYSQKHLAELKSKLEQIKQQKYEIAENYSKRNDSYFTSDLYQKKQLEEFQVGCEIEEIHDVLDDCTKQMEKEYPLNNQKYIGARNLLLKAIESYTSLRTNSSSLLALEYAMLSKVSAQGKLSPEQVETIELACGHKLVSPDIQTFVGKRMANIDEKIEQSTPTLTEIQEGQYIDDGSKFAKFQSIVNGITDGNVRGKFESVKNEKSESLPKEIGIESIINLYNIQNRISGRAIEDKNSKDDDLITEIE